MTEDESLMSNTLSSNSLKLSPNAIKREINNEQVFSSNVSPNGQYINDIKMHLKNHKKDLKFIDINQISNGISQIKTESNYLEDGQQPCSSKEAFNDDFLLKYKCPHKALFLETAYPELDKEYRDKMDEIIIDDMSLFLFKSFSDYKEFKMHEEARRKKLDMLRKQKEDEEIARLNAIKRDKMKSKYDAMKERKREKNKQLKEQRLSEREHRREIREKMKHQKLLDKEERRKWKEDYIQRKRERAERRQNKIKKLEERFKKEQQQQQSTSSEVPGPSFPTSSSSKPDVSTPQLASNLFVSPPSLPSSSRAINTPGSYSGQPSKPPPFLLNDFSNQKVAMEALQTFAGMSTSNPKLKRSSEDASLSRKNGVIFSPTSKIPKLEPLTNPAVVKTDSNEANNRQLPNVSNGYFKQEQQLLDSSLLASMPPSTSTTISGQVPNLNAALASGTSKAAAQVASFMRHSQAPPNKIHEAFSQNPQLALIFSQVLANFPIVGNTGESPAVDGRTSSTASNISDRKLSVSNGSTLSGLSNSGTTPTAPLSQYAMLAAAASAAGVHPPNVNPSTLMGPIVSQAASTKASIQNNNSNNSGTASITLGISASSASKPNVNLSSSVSSSSTSVSVSKASNTASSIGIQFPKDAALGSQLAGAAILGQKQFNRGPAIAASLIPSQWCNKHVTIAQSVLNKVKETEICITSTNNQKSIQQQHEVAKKLKLNPNSTTSMLAPPNFPPQQKQIQQQPQQQTQNPQMPNMSVTNIRPTLTPQMATSINNVATNNQQQILNLQTQMMQMNPQNSMSQWQQLLRFQQPSGNPGITTGIPPTPQHAPASDIASQELAKYYRLNQAKDQNSAQRPPSRQVERAASVAPALQNQLAGLPPASVAAFTAMLQQNQNANLNAILSASQPPQSQPQVNPTLNAGQQTNEMLRMILFQQQQHQAMQALVQADLQQRLVAEAQARQAAQVHVQQAHAQAQAQQAAVRMQNPLMQSGLLNFSNVFNAANPQAMNMNNVRPGVNMFNPFMERDKQLSAALSSQSQQQQSAGIGSVSSMQPRPNFPPSSASASNMLQQLIREQQNTQLALSTQNGMPPHSQSVNFDLNAAQQQQLLLLQQQAAVAAGAGQIRPNMLPQQLMNSNVGGRGMLDMAQFAKMQFPQGGSKGNN